jgi:NAD(P)-dependent dehydrogenase (short-subunit alcohol dehydrogenase family)
MHGFVPLDHLFRGVILGNGLRMRGIDQVAHSAADAYHNQECQNRDLLFAPDGTPTPRTDKILRATPMGRFGDPAELLGTLDWLLDADKSGFVTGVTIPVDGGFSAYSGV